MCKVKTIINNQILNLEVAEGKTIKEAVQEHILAKAYLDANIEYIEGVADNNTNHNVIREIMGQNGDSLFTENLIALYDFLGQAEDEEIDLVVNNLVISTKQFCETVDDGTVRLENAKMIIMSEDANEFFIIDELNRYYSVENF